MKKAIDGFNGRIRILGPGGVFLELADIEQRVIDSIGKKEASTHRAKAKQDAKRPRIPRGRMRPDRVFDYRTKPKGKL